MLRRLLVCVGPAILLSACNRYEYVTVECPPDPRPPLSAIAWEPVARHPGAVHLRVVMMDSSLSPVYYFRARLLPDSVSYPPSRTGEVSFRSVAPGPHELHVIGFGFSPAHVTLWVPPRDSGVEAVATMAAAVVAINELCGTRQLARKPWWKFW